MPIPIEYQRATAYFDKFMEDALIKAGLGSSHQTYTMVQGVLQTFRRRLDIKEAIMFSSVLPVILRAMFIADWDLNEDIRLFEDYDIMIKEVQALRANHNFAPETAIKDVAYALRCNIDVDAFDKVLNKLPKGAIQFWEP